MNIVDKLTPNPPPAEPGVAKDPQGQFYVLPAAPALPAKDPLTPAEQALFDRAVSFVGPALGRHGIGLVPNEVRWIAAEVADFVLDELARARPVDAVIKAPPAKGAKGTT